MLKNLNRLAILSVCFFLIYMPARASDLVHVSRHSSDTQFCSSCHDNTGLAPDASAVCLSCHDGANAVHVQTSGAQSHPVDVVYTFSSGYRTPTEVIGRGAYLSNSKVVCVSCHTPHEAQNKYNLRISNAGSALCFACHDK